MIQGKHDLKKCNIQKRKSTFKNPGSGNLSGSGKLVLKIQDQLFCPVQVSRNQVNR